MQRTTSLLLLVAAGLAVTACASGVGPTKPSRADRILKSFCDELVVLTPGQGKLTASFTMGSGPDGPAAERPAHKVTFRGPFAIAKYEVTQELYEVVSGKNPSRWKGPRNSVEMVSWTEANNFCRMLTAVLRERKHLAEGDEIRLPSEAEWEYACRAGTTTRYSFGDDVKDLTDHAWYKDNSKGHDPPVGAKRPNPWGLYDMHGYVWEWCADAWHSSYKGAPSDGSAWSSDQPADRVVRGGSWTHSADDCRCAARQPLPVHTRTAAVGFRCVRAPVADSDKGK
jgi:formylglycine-generating enzyme required for sulfatase activity